MAGEIDARSRYRKPALKMTPEEPDPRQPARSRSVGSAPLPDAALTGSRIRQRRLDLGLRQRQLAREVGISPSYLNLIEHNRRPIGGRLLLAIARRLDTTPEMLSRGAGEALVAILAEAAGAHPQSGADPASAGQLVARFPGWAELLALQQRRLRVLAQTVQALGDRLTHDPKLAAALHEILSVVTAIRSTAGILTGGRAPEPEWQARFLRNLREDSQRLAESAQALVAYFETGPAPGSEGPALPHEALEAWLDRRGWHLPELEGAGGATPEEVLHGAPELNASPSLRSLALQWLRGYRDDARRLPLGRLRAAADACAGDPVAIAARIGCDLALVLRRLASRPSRPGQAGVGLLCCDSAGMLTFRRPVEGFDLPRFGAGCPLWPLFQALSRPMAPVHALLEPAGARPLRFMAVAIAQPVPVGRLGEPQVFHAVMLLLPEDGQADGRALPGAWGEVLPVGPGCRACPRQRCPARREPSILPGAD